MLFLNLVLLFWPPLVCVKLVWPILLRKCEDVTLNHLACSSQSWWMFSQTKLFPQGKDILPWRSVFRKRSTVLLPELGKSALDAVCAHIGETLYITRYALIFAISSDFYQLSVYIWGLEFKHLFFLCVETSELWSGDSVRLFGNIIKDVKIHKSYLTEWMLVEVCKKQALSLRSCFFQTSINHLRWSDVN